MLHFSDDIQVGVMGLDEIMAELYANGKQATDETVAEIVTKLEEKNYIPSSERIRKEYAYVLLKEYRKYLKDRTGGSPVAVKGVV